MFDKVTGLKNILWAIGIVLCLLALFVGFIVSAVSPYHGESDPRTPDLNAVREKNSSADISAISFVEPDGELHQLRESKDAGTEYISSSVFLTDSVLLALREEALTGSDAVLIESNHDLQMLRDGPYPFPLKRRILSSHGHLSNTDCAQLALHLAEHGTKDIILGHLSRENNRPEIALRTVSEALGAIPVRLCCAPPEGPLELVITEE